MDVNFNEFFGEEPKMNIDYNTLNKQQLEAVNTTEGPVLIIAGAGTGKTKVLVYRLAKLIESGVNPAQILLLTFTNKAAKEMIERAQAMIDERVNKVTACTYHSFCVQILRKYCNLVDLNEGFSILSTSNCGESINLIKTRLGLDKDRDLPQGKVLASMFSFCVNKNMDLSEILEIKYPKYEDKLTTIEQIQEEYIKYKLENNLVDYDDMLTLVIKLFRENPKICKRYSDLYRYIMVDEYQDSNSLQMELLKLLRQWDNKNICVVGDDMQCLIEGTMILTKEGPKAIEQISTNDKLLVNAGRGEYVYKSPDEIFKKSHQGQIVRIKTEKGYELKATPEHIIFANYINTKDVSASRFVLFEDTRKEEGHYLHHLITDETFLINENSDILHEKIENTYMNRKAKLIDNYEAFDFIPLGKIQKDAMVCIFDGEKMIVDKVVSKEIEDYDGYVYDININNYRNYFANNICVHNCIYGFRGSNFKNIIRFPDQFKGTKVIKLIQNYRSNQEILDLANAIINNTPEKYEKQLIGQRVKNELPQLIYVNDNKDEARYIFYKIWQYHMEGVPFKDMAVLIRNAQDSTQLELLIQEYSGKKTIPFQKFGGLKFLEKEICQDILAYLAILNNVKGEVFWFRLFKLYQNIGQGHGSKLVDGVKANGIEELIDKKYEKKKYGIYLPEIYKEYHKMKKITDMERLLDYLVNTYYYKVKKRSIEESKIGTKSKTTTKADLLNKLDSDILEAQALVNMAKGYTDIDSYLEALLLDSTSEEDTSDKLTISTVHSAKGLEFKVVFIMDCIDSSYPGERPLSGYSYAAVQEHNEEIEEARRLLYVAITRAKEDLYLIYPNISVKFGKFEKAMISRFMEEDRIFEDYCESVTI